MSDLVAFLTARLDEDEAATYAADDLWLIRDDDARAVEARALREVEAKRKILARHRYGTPDYWPCPTLRALAAVYSDHPDYRQEWAS